MGGYFSRNNIFLLFVAIIFGGYIICFNPRLLMIHTKENNFILQEQTKGRKAH